MSDLDHLSLAVRSLPASRAFYEATLAPLGLRLLLDRPTGLGFGRTFPHFWIRAAGVGPVAGDAVHLCFTARDRAEVAAFHAAGLAAGGRDHGAPGLRPQYHPEYFGAFLLDPDGHNVEAVVHRA